MEGKIWVVYLFSYLHAKFLIFLTSYFMPYLYNLNIKILKLKSYLEAEP